MNRTFRRYHVALAGLASDSQPYDEFHLVCEQGTEIFLIAYTGDFEEDYRKRRLAQWLLERIESGLCISWSELDSACASCRSLKVHVF